MATIRVHGKVEGLPEGMHPLVVVELLVPATGGHAVGGVAVVDVERRFAVEATTDTQDWRQGESAFLRTSIATNSGLTQTTHADVNLSSSQVNGAASVDLWMSLPANCTPLAPTAVPKAEPAGGAFAVPAAVMLEAALPMQPWRPLGQVANSKCGCAGGLATGYGTGALAEFNGHLQTSAA